MKSRSKNPQPIKGDDAKIARISKGMYNKFVDSEIKEYFIDAYGPKHGRDHYKTFAFKEKKVFIAAKRDGKVVGALVLRIERTTASIGAFAVSKRSRGKGIGSHLIRESVALARKSGCDKVWLWTFPASPACRFYKKEGFSEEARLKRQFGSIDLCIMSRFI